MLKLFYERLKDQAGLVFVPVLIVASLVITGLGLWSVGTEAQKTIDNKKELAKFAEEKNTEDAEAYQEQINKALVKTAVEGGKVAVGTVAGVHDTYLANTALAAAGAFDTEKRKTVKLDKLKPLLQTQEELDRLMQLTEDEIDRLMEKVMEDELDRIDEEAGEDPDTGEKYSEEEIEWMLQWTESLDYGIEKMVEKKVELNSDPETTPQEKKAIVDETIKNIQKAEKSNTKVDLNSWVQTILKGSDKLADQKLVDLRYKLKKIELSYDYNFSIIEQYEEIQAKGQGISDTTALAEAKRRVADLYDETRIIEAKIKELEDAKKVPESTPDTVTKPTETIPETNTQPTETTPDTVLPAELNLKGTMNVKAGFAYQLTLNINFETQVVSGTLAYSGPITWEHVFITDRETGNIIKEAFDITLPTTANGTINGKIDINSKIIEAPYSILLSTTWEGKSITSEGSSTMSGSLDANNNASGTTSSGASWSASPY
jgi:hypothetical protein